MTTKTNGNGSVDTSYKIPVRRNYISKLEATRKGFITNYPNYQHWKRLGAEQMRADRPFNIYLHSPFCIQRCSYCYYKTINLRGTDKRARMVAYVDALVTEIQRASEYYGLKDRPLLSAYFGGGTPSLLPPDQLERVIETIDKYLTRTPETEFTVEAEPVTMTNEKARLFERLGVNRISMGVQSFDEDIIKQSNRLDNEKKALKAIEIARSTGAVVNIDLMSGLAGETDKTWEHSVRRAIESEAQSITVYKTELYTNTPYFKGIREDTLVLPNDDKELDFMQYSLDRLAEADYKPWSFYTFTKHGAHPHVHSPSVFNGDDYYAFGVSAFGRLGDYLFQNTNDENKYIDIVMNRGELPVMRGHYMTSIDNMVRDVVLGLKLVSYDLGEFQRRYGFRLEKLTQSVFDKLIDEDMIQVDGDNLSLTEKGILHGDYAGKSLGRHLQEMSEA